MTAFLAALALFAAGALAAVALSSRPRLALAAATAAAALGCAAGLLPALRVLAGGPALDLSLAWNAPLAGFHLRLDPLAALFLAPLFALGIPASLFGAWYLRPSLGRRGLGAFLCAYDLFLAALALVFAARHAALLLAAWEAMAVSSFLLVSFDHADAQVRRAGLVYLVASHLGAAFLFALFLLLGREAGSFDLDAIAAVRGGAVAPALAFGLALVGFGVKAGLPPLHLWLPEAHPAAPSHVSALMSGVLVKAGLYGILRVVTLLPPAPAGHGAVLLGLGLAGALGGITLALGQRDLKRALACSTIENVGLVTAGLGAALSARALGAPAVAALAALAALFHVWNHALMKGLAFLSAGAVVHATGTRDLEAMGGLLRRMPAVGGLLLAACAALSALPPWNGFASEWLLFSALLRGAVDAPGAAALGAGLALTALALVSGLAALAFTRVAGVALLGEPRSEAARTAHAPGAAAWGPLLALGAGCLALGLFPGAALRLVAPAAAQLLDRPAEELLLAAGPAVRAGGGLQAGVLAFVALAGALELWRRLRVRRQGQVAGETWGCGFTVPSARVQYTASSYAQLLLSTVAPRLLQPRARVTPPQGVFPGAARFEQRVQDPAEERLFGPLFHAAARRFRLLRGLQSGKLNLQLLYTLVTLVVLVAILALRSRP
ncbi:proton-conducting transporter transmembrane domain-containing protein [Anaeromyxobacter paludicola]|uniref:Hydrogenase n=1 Tax=Anaeromyxobacter paludicola TaxID=2918171 RepID=A0ABM7XEV8_9BACT|nr:proton-conducting transporter membrane subunit [Anaeromyxobacter paludicola]BDG10414.1 hydrogenase [Anaeromyxobacter paludicola]